MKLSRRQFLTTSLATLAAALLASYRFFQFKKVGIPGKICGANFSAGHLLREFAGKEPDRNQQAGVVIVGSGIAGLSAGWKLAKSGYQDFLILELENQPGGNSQFGANTISQYPWGAHYVPTPGSEAALVREFFSDIGLIEGYDAQGQPMYNELYTCHAPQERLHHYGQWQEGLLPKIGISDADRQQYQDFFALIESLREKKGQDGKPLFAIPVAMSSTDKTCRELDTMSMSQFLAQKGFTSKTLTWYVNYCCRDDYGATIEQVSAWAGLHYFASRMSDEILLTWPAGNGWLVQAFVKRLHSFIHCQKLVMNITQTSAGASVNYLDLQKKEVVRINCQAVIYAAPRFTAPHVIADLRKEKPAYGKAFTYAPWMVANISMKKKPSGYGADLAWDNVFYGADSLGYVVATHQNISVHQKKTVLTYYRPLTASEPETERKKALTTPFETWRDLVVADLDNVHPGIANLIERIDIWIWGHGMIRPTPGFIWGQDRQQAQAPLGRLHFAHSDMSGISIFEEAQFHGVKAAEQVMTQLGQTFETSLAGAA